VSCLTDEEIQALSEGRADGAARERGERHLDECGECRRVLAAVFEDTAPASNGEVEAGALRASSVLPPGTRLSRYVLGELVGAGGMGLVYAAEDPELRRRVAIKLLRPGLDESAAHRVRFLREARAMAQLTHPNVVTVYDVGTAGEQSFVVMELVRGGTLREWLRQPRAVSEVLAVFLRAGQGLAAAHAAGLVHRDFKPENVLLSEDGRVLVSDFGLARSLSRQEWSNVSHADGVPKLLGTPLYMSPEQLRGEAATVQSDVFAFSVALYAALHGKPPFWGETLRELLEAIERGVPQDTRPRWRVSGRLMRLLRQGLREDPAARPQLSELLSLLGGAGFMAHQGWLTWAGGALLMGFAGWAFVGWGDALSGAGRGATEPLARQSAAPSAPSVRWTLVPAAPSAREPLSPPPARSLPLRPSSEPVSLARSPHPRPPPAAHTPGAASTAPRLEPPRDPFMTPLSLSAARRAVAPP
jgi:hypothetical protein